METLVVCLQCLLNHSTPARPRPLRISVWLPRYNSAPVTWFWRGCVGIGSRGLRMDSQSGSGGSCQVTRKKLHLTVWSGNNCVVTTVPESDCIFKFTGAVIRWFAKKGRRTSTFIKPFPGIASGGRLKAMITISQNGVRSNALMILHIPWGSRSGGNIPARFAR